MAANIENIEKRIRELEKRGVTIIDPRQTYISEDVDLSRVYPGSVLYPGTRLSGARTLVGSFAQIGTEGPAAICDTIVGPHAEVASGFLSGATLLPEAKAGANSHYRAGTLLEEHASTAHSVGLKQTILMYGVTLGSLINFCDILMSGGHSRKEHSEVGSGFIHFNYTPWGTSGDKATPSLIGNVTEGVFLDKQRIFLGGMSGIVGPLSVGFGAMTVAGQVVRRSVTDNTMHGENRCKIDTGWSATDVKFSGARLEKIKKNNIEFLTQLCALRQWYLQIRLERSRCRNDEELSQVLLGALDTIQACIQERILRYNSLAKEWGLEVLPEHLREDAADLAPSVDWKPELEYDKWIWGLKESEKNELHGWLHAYADRVRSGLQRMLLCSSSDEV